MAAALDTHLGLRAFVDELARCGVREACTSPGSRSTPLVLALVAEARIRSSSHLDERSGSFYALGVAKASGVPAVLACTSGTAAANYAPAVIEAHEARVPMVVLTADRPPEMRDVGAGQTIDQLKLYGGAAKWFADVDDAEATEARLRWLRGLACRAVWTATEGRPGPVHLNFALREPLVPDGPLPEEDPVPGRAGGRPWVTRPRLAAPAPPAAVEGLEAELAARPRAVVVAGRQERDLDLSAALAAFAERFGLPLLAEPLSGARRGPAAIAHYDALLRDAAFAAEHAPQLVIRVGDLPTSGPLRRWLGGPACASALQLAFDPEAAWQDPAGAVATLLATDPRPVLEAVVARAGAVPKPGGLTVRSSRQAAAAAARPAVEAPPGWLEAWQAADQRAAAGIARVLGEEHPGLNEPRVAAELGVRLPAAATLLVASSMPVRDVETFFPARPDPPRVLANRGANGIDGTTSTAFGVAAASPGGPTVLLTGDVTLLHDVGGLLAARRLGARLTVVLLDNDGGGIFHFLPVASAEAGSAAFETHVATPHGVPFAAVAEAFGCVYEAPGSPEAFRVALDRGLAHDGVTFLHVRTDREANVAVHRRVWSAVTEP